MTEPTADVYQTVVLLSPEGSSGQRDALVDSFGSPVQTKIVERGVLYEWSGGYNGAAWVFERVGMAPVYREILLRGGGFDSIRTVPESSDGTLPPWRVFYDGDLVAKLSEDLDEDGRPIYDYVPFDDSAENPPSSSP